MNSKINNGNWVVLYYSENCGYCTDFLPIWDLFEKKKNKKLNKLKLNINSLDLHSITPPINGVPTVHFYNNGKITKDGIFNNERTLLELNKFCVNNLKSKKSKKSKKTKKAKKAKKSN